MTFGIGVVAIRHSAEKCLKKPQCGIDVILSEMSRYVAGGVVYYECIGHDVCRHKGLGQTNAHLIVGYAESITVEILIIVLYRDISALIQQGHYGGHALCRSVEVVRSSLHPADVGGEGIELAQHLNEISGSARCKPIIGELMVLECVKETVRIEDTRRGPCEMVTVILALQLGNRHLVCHPTVFGKVIHIV